MADAHILGSNAITFQLPRQLVIRQRPAPAVCCPRLFCIEAKHGQQICCADLGLLPSVKNFPYVGQQFIAHGAFRFAA
jgi:hypothetical protein